MKLQTNPVPSKSIHVVPPADLAKADAHRPHIKLDQLPFDPKNLGHRVQVSWPVLVPSEDFKAALAQDPQLFGDYLAQAIDANEAYFFPAESVGAHGTDPIFGLRARDLFDEAIALAKKLYPVSDSGRSEERDAAYAAIDSQTSRVFTQVFGDGHVKREDGSTLWSSTCHWPTSPTLVARFADVEHRYDVPERPDSKYIPFDFGGEQLFDGSLRKRPADEGHFEFLRQVYKDDPELLAVIRGEEKVATASQIHTAIPGADSLKDMPATRDLGPKLIFLDLCHGLDAERPIPPIRPRRDPLTFSDYFGNRGDES